MTVKEFTVIKPKTERVLVPDKSANDSMVFKDIPIDISDITLFKKIQSMITVLSSSFCETGEIKIVTDSTDEEIKQCLIENNLIMTGNRTDLVMEQDDVLDDDGEIVSNTSRIESEFKLSIKDQDSIKKTILSKTENEKGV